MTIIEIMGRHAGWLTAASKLARKYEGDNPILIYLPEGSLSSWRPFTRIWSVPLKKQPMWLSAFPRALPTPEEPLSCEYSDAAKLDSFGHKMLTAAEKSWNPSSVTGSTSRSAPLSSNVSQRCSGMLASRTDIEEFAMAGAFGVRAALSGETGKMAAFQRISDVPYELSCCLEPVGRICNQEKKFPAEWITEGGSDVTDSFLPYILPLIQGEPERIMENGLPRYLYRQPDAAARIKP